VSTPAPDHGQAASPQNRWSKIWAALTTSRGLTGREVALAWLALAVFCALVYAPHVRHGGFYLDDWSNAAETFEPKGGPGFGNVISSFAAIGIYRPVLVIYVPVTYWVFGMHLALHLAWAAALAMLAAGMLYGVLRTLSVPRIHAWAVAALTIVFPWSDSTKLWATGDQVTLAVTLALAGLWIALAGLSRRSWRWHAWASLLYLLSILAYEVTLPLIALAGVLYTVRAGWRKAKPRWGMDLAAVLAGGIWVGTQTVRTKSGPSGDFSHLKQIVSNGNIIFGRTILPVGSQRTTLAVGLFFAVFAIGLVAWLRLPARFGQKDGWGLREWLLLAGGGLLVAVLGWIIFIPADPYYTPSIYGVTNRVNGLAGIGLVMAAYGMCGIAGSLIGQVRPRTSAVALAVTLTLGACLGLFYVHVIRRHTQIWDAAYAAEKSGMNEIQTRFPRLPHGTTLFASGYPANQTLGVPIFGATWDLYGMVKTHYEDGTLSAYPILYGSRLACQPRGIQLQGKGLEAKVKKLVPYGRAQLFDLESHLQAKPRTQKECLAAVGSYKPGPLYLSSAY
jgi:hypothetical protein